MHLGGVSEDLSSEVRDTDRWPDEHIALTRSRTIKITLIIIVIALTIPVILFANTADDFAPGHVAMMGRTAENGSIPQNYESVQVPAFYAYGATLMLITGLPVEDLLFAPINLVPYAAVLFLLLYFISGSKIFAAALVLIDLITGTDGSGRIMLWPHGVGFILFATIAVALIAILKGRAERPIEHLLLIPIAGLSMIFISYNNTAQALLLLISLGALLAASDWIASKRAVVRKPMRYSPIPKVLCLMALVMVVSELGLSRFVYEVFLPQLSTSQYIEISSFSKLLLQYFGGAGVDPALSDVYLTYPISITVISLAKYGILLSAIVATMLLSIRGFMRNRYLTIASSFAVAIFIATMLFGLPRLMMGGLIILLLYFPGIICISYIYGNHKQLKKAMALSLLALLLLTVAYYVQNDELGLIDRNKDRFAAEPTPAYWLNENLPPMTVGSDVSTIEFFRLMIAQGDFPDDDGMNERFGVLTTEDVRFLLLRSENSTHSAFIINHELGKMALSNWAMIKSWSYTDHVIRWNADVDKVYDSNLYGYYLRRS